MNKLYQEGIEQLKEMVKISKSAKEIFHAMQEMLRRASNQIEKD